MRVTQGRGRRRTRRPPNARRRREQRSPASRPSSWRKLREVVRNTEDVGERFPEEARKIHYEETPARAIRGKASREEAEALPDEGIEFAPLPPFLTRDSH